VSTTTYVFGILSALAVLAVVTEMLRRRRVRERHALWWTIAGILALVVAVFPDLLISTARAVGIEVPLNLGFFLALLLLFLVTVQQGTELTSLEEKTRLLAESVALLDERLERHEPSGVRHAPRDPGQDDTAPGGPTGHDA